ncbi:hypothetical protein SAMN05216226_11622 [Halovenus aranensis]|jgi:hypothetical protein|uniref:Uncharacterized protein n=1 Tax=Halovenus aranensis TaxID=890420 RepID=A0A1G8YVH7_9EURY|nr:DUF5791 family protein [Halovenus aranensis]SDK05990.1 hypothetical protein SAMN05216226_11622 [Halovenus aranensis]
MLRGRFEDAGELSPEELRAAYDDRLATAIDTVGKTIVAEAVDVDEAVLSGLVEGESPELTLTTAAEILALDDELPDAESIVAEARDILLMGMSIAVLDVEAIASGLDDEMEPKEIQQKTEGRFPMTLDEYALVHNYIERNKQ